MIVIAVRLGPISMRSALLSHSERSQRAAPGLERRPRKNGAGTASQWNHPGNNNKGKSPTNPPPTQTIIDLTFCHQSSKDIIISLKMWCANGSNRNSFLLLTQAACELFLMQCCFILSELSVFNTWSFWKKIPSFKKLEISYVLVVFFHRLSNSIIDF